MLARRRSRTVVVHRFSVRAVTAMRGSQLGYRLWAWALYLMQIHGKGIASVTMGKLLGIRQQTAWHRMQRWRAAMDDAASPWAGPVEVDETDVGGKARHKHATQRRRQGRGTVGKAIVVGMQDRASGQVAATVVQRATKRTLQTFIATHLAPGVTVSTDDAAVYRGLPPPPATVAHAKGKDVAGAVHTNGIESFWATLKRRLSGTYRWVRRTHLGR